MKEIALTPLMFLVLSIMIYALSRQLKDIKTLLLEKENDKDSQIPRKE